MYPSLKNLTHIGLDTETTGLRYPRDKAFCVSLCTPDRSTFYIDFRYDQNAVKWLERELKDYKGTIICHNASFDFRMLASAGCSLPIQQMDDTCIRACLLNEHESTIFPWTKRPGNFSLDYLSAKYLGEKKRDEIYEELAAIFGGRATRNVQMPNISKAPPEIVAPYAEYDALLALELWEYQNEQIHEQGIEQITEFERKLMPTLIRAEMRGIRVDLDYAHQAKDKMDVVVKQAQKTLNIDAGWDVNTNSPKQIRELFRPKKTESGVWFAEDGTVLESTGTGNPSFGGNTLREMKDPRAAKIVELRSLIKTRDTFLGKHVIEHSINGRVYPNINQTKGEDGGTGTGRLSYTEPAMQQIPSRNKKIAKIVKPAFLPEEGQIWVSSDLSSFEVRVFAHLVAAYNNTITEVYKKNPNTDFHQYVADLMGVPRNATYSGQANGKQLNLSMIFNSGNGAIADGVGMPWEWAEFKDKKGKIIRYKKAGKEAMDMIAKYHAHVPGVKKLATRAKEIAESRGWIKTMFGRRLRFPKGYKSYKSSGLLIQATSADINKENWMIIEEALGDDGHMILNTHDSYPMSIDENWEPVWERVKNAVQRDVLRVPLLIDFEGVGKNWADSLYGS